MDIVAAYVGDRCRKGFGDGDGGGEEGDKDGDATSQQCACVACRVTVIFTTASHRCEDAE